MPITNKRHFIDNIKVVLIFLVVFGHLIERYIDTSDTLMAIYMFIYILLPDSPFVNKTIH